MRFTRPFHTIICALAMSLAAITATVKPLAAAPAESNNFITRQKQFIQTLFNRGDYFNCIAETRRLLAFSPDIQRRDAYLYFIEVNYYLGGQYRTVIGHLSAASGPADMPSRLLLARAYAADGRTADGLRVVQNTDYHAAGAFSSDVLMRAVELHVLESHYDGALAELSRYEDATRFSADFAGIRLSLEGYKNIRTRSRTAAAAMSAMLPGVGQLWAGRPLDAIISLASVAALAAGSAVMFDRGRRQAGFTLGFFAALFYAGNIYGAYNAAAAWNAARETEFRGAVMKHIPPYDPAKHLVYDELFK